MPSPGLSRPPEATPALHPCLDTSEALLHIGQESKWIGDRRIDPENLGNSLILIKHILDLFVGENRFLPQLYVVS